MNDLPVPLIKVLDLCEKVMQNEADSLQLKECLPQLLQFVNFEASSFERFSWDLLWTDKFKEKFGMSAVELDAHRVAIKDIETALADNDMFALEKAARDLKLSAVALWEIWQELRAEQACQESMSPYPVFDRLLKVLHNILGKNISDAPLGLYFSPAADLTIRLGAAVKRFRLFYGESVMTQKAEASVNNLEVGLGAVDEYMRSGSEVALQDALHLLVPASLAIYVIVQDMGIIASNERKYAKHPLIEELFRARECALTGYDLDMLWKAVQAAIKLNLTRVQSLVAHPLAALAELNTDLLVQGAAWINDIVTRSLNQKLEDVPLEELDKLMMHWDTLIAVEEGKVNHEYALVDGAPNFEEMIVSVGLAMSGGLSAEAFGIVLGDLQEHIATIIGELNGAVGTMDMGDWERLYALLEQQQQACAEMQCWQDDGRVAHLREGWHALSATIPETLALGRKMRENLVGKEADAAVMCMKCGASNQRGIKFCAKCGAVLMQLAAAPVEYTEIGDEGAPVAYGTTTPRNIALIEDVIRQVEEGQAGPDEVAALFDQLIPSAEKFRGIFMRHMRPHAENEGLGADVLDSFQDGIDAYLEGLRICAQFVQDNDMNNLYRGFELCSSAAMCLQDLEAQLPQ